MISLYSEVTIHAIAISMQTYRPVEQPKRSYVLESHTRPTDTLQHDRDDVVYDSISPDRGIGADCVL